MFYKVLNILWSQFLMDVANISGITIFRCILGGMPLFELKKKTNFTEKKIKKKILQLLLKNLAHFAVMFLLPFCL